MKIEAGRWYKTRNGEKRYCVGRSPAGTPWVLVDEFGRVNRYWEDGRYYVDQRDPYDIIDEWREPETYTVYVHRNKSGGTAFASAQYSDTEYWQLVAITTVTEGTGLEGMSHGRIIEADVPLPKSETIEGRVGE